MPKPLVGRLAAECSVRAVVVVMILPFLQLVGEETGVVDDLALQEAVELLGVDPVGSLYLAVQPRRAGSDLDVVDAKVGQMQVERRAELGPVEFLSDVKLLWS